MERLLAGRILVNVVDFSELKLGLSVHSVVWQRLDRIQNNLDPVSKRTFMGCGGVPTLTVPTSVDAILSLPTAVAFLKYRKGITCGSIPFAIARFLA
jgi:hypothetical protein